MSDHNLLLDVVSYEQVVAAEIGQQTQTPLRQIVLCHLHTKQPITLLVLATKQGNNYTTELFIFCKQGSLKVGQQHHALILFISPPLVQLQAYISNFHIFLTEKDAIQLQDPYSSFFASQGDGDPGWETLIYTY